LDLQHPQENSFVKGGTRLGGKAETLKSPCIKVCQMDPVKGVCIGCCRTLDEIARWGGMTDAERETVMKQLVERRRNLDVPEIAVPPLA
jgi:hypothetical protein